LDKAVEQLVGPRFGVPPQPGVGFIPERERPDESTQHQPRHLRLGPELGLPLGRPLL
jgi:hypothetical protein